MREKLSSSSSISIIIPSIGRPSLSKLLKAIHLDKSLKKHEIIIVINSQILNGKSKLDTINYDILKVLTSDIALTKDKLKTLTDSNTQIQAPYVLLKRYNKPNDNIL